mgnify:CR=1 FL=1
MLLRLSLSWVCAMRSHHPDPNVIKACMFKGVKMATTGQQHETPTKGTTRETCKNDFTESWNHKIKAAKIILSNCPPTSNIAPLNYIPRYHIYPFFKHLQGQWLHHFLGQPVPIWWQLLQFLVSSKVFISDFGWNFTLPVLFPLTAVHKCMYCQKAMTWISCGYEMRDIFLC